MKIDKIKTHLKEHKKFYVGLGVGVGIAGITCYIMRDFSRSQRIDRGIAVVANRGISVVADRSVVTNNVSFISSRHQGPPSWIVRCVETNEVFLSQRSAAENMRLAQAEISQHLNGKMNHVRGYTFERICMAV